MSVIIRINSIRSLYLSSLGVITTTSSPNATRIFSFGRVHLSTSPMSHKVVVYFSIKSLNLSIFLALLGLIRGGATTTGITNRKKVNLLQGKILKTVKF